MQGRILLLAGHLPAELPSPHPQFLECHLQLLECQERRRQRIRLFPLRSFVLNLTCVVYEARGCEEWWQGRGAMKSYGKEAGRGRGCEEL